MPRCFIAFLLLVVSYASAEYEPPAGYYASATGTGTQLKSQLHNIIDGHTDLGYNALRTLLQITDEDPDNPGHVLLVYDRTSLDLAGIGGSIPGWDNGNSWNREHTWPRSRGVDSSGPDNSDLHNHRPSDPQINADRASLNFGGAYGAQPYGFVSDGGTKWYPGDADAGMIARQEFYMAVRYDGGDPATTNLELAAGNPGGNQLGDLNRMIQWHFAAPPDNFERRRNQLIFGYQKNRNPFTDHPEFAWSVFVDQSNDSQVTLQGVPAADDGGTSLALDLGRVYVGGAAPQPQSVTLNKSGLDGTYFEVSASGDATSSLAGGFNAFRTGQTDSTQLTVGLDVGSSLAGVTMGEVMIDNLDVTNGAGAGHGALDADDSIDLTYTVLEHPVASFASDAIVSTFTVDLGELTLGPGLTALPAVELFNYAGPDGPLFASYLELDSTSGTGDTGRLQLFDSAFTGLTQGDSAALGAMVDTSTEGEFSATYELMLSGEDLIGDQTQSLLLTLNAVVSAAGLAGDFNADGLIDAADYTVWRDGLGGEYDAQDYADWRANYGQTSTAALPAPSPAAQGLALVLAAAFAPGRYSGRWPSISRK